MSSDNSVRIRVDGLSKRYEMYAQPSDRLKQMVFPRVQRAVRREAQSYFKEFWALRGVTFDVKKGETVGIVGRNGSGKSTLLQLICNTLTPTAGTVKVDGRISALLELGAGFNPEFTGRENVLLSGLVYGISESDIRDRLGDIIEFAGIGDFIDQPVKTYSSGMYVRLAFAVAISVSPDVLVVDEALAVGDEAFQRKCLSRIDAIRDAGATVLFVSHSAGTVVELCNRAVLLDGGEMLAVGTPKEIVTTYQKLLYAPAERVRELREEIAQSYRITGAVPSTESFGDGAVAPDDAAGGAGEHDDDPAYLDDGLVSKSVIEYARQGASIENPRLETITGRRVNVLAPGRNYVYAYEVRLERTLARVRCGMMVRSMTGIEVSGAASMLQQDAMPIAESGLTLYVRFKFCCRLHPGVYFLNAGVLAALQEGEDYVDRRVDLLMFRVMPVPTRLATGFVDLLVDEPEVRIV